MAKSKTKKAISNIAVAIASILAWLSGFIVMRIVYESLAASIVFGTVIAIIVFFESRFSYISLKSDGRIEITKEEVKSNLWQIIAATFMAFIVSIPLELKVYEESIVTSISGSANDLGLQIQALGKLFSENWTLMLLICIIVVVIYQLPIFLRMKSEG